MGLGEGLGWAEAQHEATFGGSRTAAGRACVHAVSLEPGSRGVSPCPCAAPCPPESRGERAHCSPGQLTAAGPAAPSPPPQSGADSAYAPQPLLSLDNSVTTRFVDTGDVRVTVQAACGNSVLQDSKVIRVLGESLLGRGQGTGDRGPQHAVSSRTASARVVSGLMWRL